MREIRFKIMFEGNTRFTAPIEWYDLQIAPKNIKEIVQSSGLKDKNGTEIFEGDMVCLKSQYETEEPIDTKSKVEFSDGSFRLDFHGMILNWAVLEYSKSNWLIEVIGNIYENPELLTPPQK